MPFWKERCLIPFLKAKSWFFCFIQLLLFLINAKRIQYSQLVHLYIRKRKSSIFIAQTLYTWQTHHKKSDKLVYILNVNNPLWHTINVKRIFIQTLFFFIYLYFEDIYKIYDDTFGVSSMSQSKVKYSNMVLYPLNVFDIQSSDWIVNVIEGKIGYLRENCGKTFNRYCVH